ncbi:MAG: hypothetical protein ACYCXR_09045 [Coriobacteriia bacterium]
MKTSKAVLLLLACTVVAFGLLFGVLSLLSGASQSVTTLVAALGGALVASLGPVVTALISSVNQTRDTDERIRDEASRVALELTGLDYELRQQALEPGGRQQFLAPAKVYRELYKAVVELRTNDTWPQTIEELGLLNIFEVARPKRLVDR